MLRTTRDENDACPDFCRRVWINVSEFFRNEVFLKLHWLEHFEMIGRPFPSGALIHALDTRNKPFFSGAVA